MHGQITQLVLTDEHWRVSITLDSHNLVVGLSIQQAYDLMYLDAHGALSEPSRDDISKVERRGELVEVVRDPPDSGLTTTFVRSLRIPELAERARQLIPNGYRRQAGEYSILDDREKMASERKAEEWASRFAGRPGRAGRPDLEYALLALEYLKAVEDNPRKPTDLLGRRLNISRATASNKVHEARRRGLLTSPSPLSRRAGGQLTVRAQQILRQHREANQ